MEEKKLIISYRILQYGELSQKYQNLIYEAKKQVENAYAPYSNFKVGASVLMNNGAVVGGNNQENAAYPSGLCAERVALFSACSQYPKESVKAIAIAAYTNDAFLDFPITPCGSCRQVLIECESKFNEPIDILLYGSKEVYLIKSSFDLLPFAFKPESLNKY